MVYVTEPFSAAGEDASKGDSVDLRGRPQQQDAGDSHVGPSRTEEVGGQPLVEWLRIARDSYQTSERYVDSSLRWQWERNERAFQSRHPPGSKYLSDHYKSRSKLFRPKTRTMIRTGEAQAAASFFSNEDVVTVNALDTMNPQAQASAKLNHELLQYRLTTPNKRIAIPWFQTLVGAYQDAQKYGVVASKQWWEFVEQTETEYEEQYDWRDKPMTDMEGNPVVEPVETSRVRFDRPRCDLIAPENVRIDRAADWIDPINTSPFVILVHPMYVHEIQNRAKEPDPKTGEPPWYEVPVATLKTAASRHEWDSTRTEREQNREDSKESETPIDEFSIVWVHENMVHWEGEDWVYYTAGVHEMLSPPKRLVEVYPHLHPGERPVVMGYSILETHKAYPSGKPQLTEQLQQETNDIANLRLDNVKLALAKRWVVRRGRQVDLQSILRNTPGSVTLANDIDDVKEIQTRDVTQSAYAEQDRINVDFDSIAGNFDQGTVQTNRKMNETVGGMEILHGAATQISELDLRVFTETWVEPVLNQIVRMEQFYETDERILALAGENAQLAPQFGINEVTDELLMQELVTKVNVGIGATDPQRRLQKLQLGLTSLVELFGEQVRQKLNFEEIVKEVMGPLGYRDGSRFFKEGPDPQVAQLMEQLQQMQQQMEAKAQDNEAKYEIERLKQIGDLLKQYLENQGGIQEEQIKAESDWRRQGLENYEQELQTASGLFGNLFDQHNQDAERGFKAQEAERERGQRMSEKLMDQMFQGQESERDRQVQQQQNRMTNGSGQQR